MPGLGGLVSEAAQWGEVFSAPAGWVERYQRTVAFARKFESAVVGERLLLRC